jgi:hypothetical protein
LVLHRARTVPCRAAVKDGGGDSRSEPEIQRAMYRSKSAGMSTWVIGIAGSVLLALAAAGLASAIGSRVWERQTAALVDRLHEAASDGERLTYSSAATDDLPAPVARYFAFALPPGQTLVRRARVEHRGEFRSGPDRGWSPFESVQHFTTDPPGFVWDARIRMAPGMTVRVRDSYVITAVEYRY